MTTVPPIRREILVDAGPQTAFDVFTAGIGRWWPVPGHSVHGVGGTVAFTGGQLVEQSATGQQAVWGTVTRWEPPAAGVRVRLRSAGARSRSAYRGMTAGRPPG